MKWDAEKYDRVNIQQNESGRELLALAHVQKTDSILDVGCGTGKLTAEMARLAHGGCIMGIDPSPDMIRKAKARCNSLNNVMLMQISAENISCPGRFDLVFSNLALQWIKNIHRVTGSIYRSLKPGGRIAFQLPAAHFSPEFFECTQQSIDDLGYESIFRDWGPPWFLPTARDYLELLSISGFKRVRVVPKQYILRFNDASGAVDWWSPGLAPYMEELNKKTQERFQYSFAMNSERHRSNGVIEFSMNRLFAFGEK